MVYPELRSILSPDLEPPTLPADPQDCSVEFRLQIGPRGGGDVEAYSFTVVTPAHLRRSTGPVWARGYLIIDVFDWHAVVLAVAQLLAECARPSWTEAVAELGRQLRRESVRNGQSDR
jgi:hypothetical protein